MVSKTSNDSEQESYYQPIKNRDWCLGVIRDAQKLTAAIKTLNSPKSKEKGMIQRITPQLLT